MFLKEPDDGVDDHNRANRESIEQFADARGQHTCAEEQPDSRARELACQKGQPSGCLLTTNPVRTKLSETSLGFGRRKARCDLQRRRTGRIRREQR